MIQKEVVFTITSDYLNKLVEEHLHINKYNALYVDKYIPHHTYTFDIKGQLMDTEYKKIVEFMLGKEPICVETLLLYFAQYKIIEYGTYKLRI